MGQPVPVRVRPSAPSLPSPLIATAAYPVEARRLPTERRLRLTWSDGHVGEYEYELLRGWCPCAMCQGHHALEITFHPPAQPVELHRIEPVGNYGLSFLWSDGHGSGIYRFEYVRQLCPCPACQPVEDEPGEP